MGEEMIAASQDFRDGAGLGARIVAERIIAANFMGILLTHEQLRAMAEEVRSTYGGGFIEDARAREAARGV
jgi:hypothetical protein